VVVGGVVVEGCVVVGGVVVEGCVVVGGVVVEGCVVVGGVGVGEEAGEVRLMMGLTPAGGEEAGGAVVVMTAVADEPVYPGVAWKEAVMVVTPSPIIAPGAGWVGSESVALPLASGAVPRVDPGMVKVTRPEETGRLPNLTVAIACEVPPWVRMGSERVRVVVVFATGGVPR